MLMAHQLIVQAEILLIRFQFPNYLEYLFFCKPMVKTSYSVTHKKL